MIRKPLLVLLIAGTIGVAAGCGSSSSTTKTTTPPAAANTTAATTASATTASATSTSASGGSSGTPSSPVVAQAVATCKAAVNAHSTLSASLKAKLVDICNQGANGNVAAAKKLFAKVCTQIVNATVPSAAGSAVKNQALAACKKA